jgi:hypothetical protein
LLSWAPDLKEDDIQVTSSGAPGEDLKLSPAAQVVYSDLVWECKNVEKLNVHEAFAQAESHVAKRGRGVAILCFARNRTEPKVVLNLEDFLRLIR